MSSLRAFEEGTKVGGGYRVIRPLADGGMGAVYEVEQLATGARRALKVLHASLARDADLRARFVQEARVGASIASDHVAEVVDAGFDEASGLPFLVMELLEGVTLAHEISRREHLDWPTVREVFRQLGHAVAAAHARGVVHRDLKPANVFLAHARTAGMPFVLKVLDFGIAEIAAGARDESGRGVIGTPSWMAPEQIDPRAPIGPQADVWAMGLIAFAALVGRHYWPIANMKNAPTDAVLERVANDEIVPASVRAASYDAASRVPPGFDAWFERCVARDPRDRFPDAGAAQAGFSAMMRAALGGATDRSLPPLAPVAVEEARAVTLRDDGPVHETTRPGSRVSMRARVRKRRGWVIAAGALLGCAGLAAFLVTRARPHDAAASMTTPPETSATHAVLRLHGSNTIGAELAPALAQAFLARETGVASPTVVHTAPDEMLVEAKNAEGATESIEIAAHGSATAFTDLARGACDVGMASRRVRADEVAQLAALGPMASAASEHVIALDGIAVIVNPANPVVGLTKAQLAAIFSGQVTRWSAVGGADAPIDVVARDDRSGTWDTFKSLVLAGRALAPGARRIEASDALADVVAGDANAIGFVGLAYVRSAKAVMVQEGGATLLPSATTVATEDYALSRRLFLYAPPGAGDVARRFVDFALSDDGQAVVARAGFVDLRPKCDPNAKPCATCGDLLASACRMSVDFRFDAASKQLDTRALRDFQRLDATLARPEYAGKKLVLLGFSDGDGDGGVASSLARAKAVADQLRARGLAVDAVRGLGAESRVADDSDEAGRERNRRVEVWLR